MTRLLHVADSYLGERPYGVPEREEDLWRAFDCAVDTAIAERVDVFLHAGMLVGAFADMHAVAPRLRDALDRLAGEGVTTVLAQGSHDLSDVQADCVVAPGWPEACAGLCFTCDVEDGAGDRPVVLLAHGRVDGMSGMGVSEPLIDAVALARSDAAYCALSGLERLQPVQPNAWYSGQTARVSLHDRSQPGGLIVDIGEHSGTIRELRRVTWPDRPHRTLRIEGRGLDGEQLSLVLEERVRDVCALAEQEPREPVVLVRVDNPAVALDELLTDDRLWVWNLREGGPIYTEIQWGSERRALGRPQ